MASFGLSGFAQGLANSPLGNLPSLMMAKDQMKARKEDKAARAAEAEQMEMNNQQLQELVAGGDLKGASEFALTTGNYEAFEGLQALSKRNQDETQWNAEQDFKQDELDWKQDKFDKEHGLAVDTQDAEQGLNQDKLDFEQNKFGQEHALNQATQEGAQDVAVWKAGQGQQELDFKIEESKSKDDSMRKKENTKNLAQKIKDVMGATRHGDQQQRSGEWLSRVFQKNSKIAEEMFDLESHRKIIGADIANSPNGPMVSLQIYNTKTGTAGPATENGTADSGDNVMTLPLDAFMRVVDTYAGASGTGKEKPTDDYSVSKIGEGYGVLNKKTGKVEHIEKTKQAQHEHTMKRVGETIDQITKQPGTLAGLSDHIPKLRANAGLIATHAAQAGMDPSSAVYAVMSILQNSNLDVVKKFEKAKTLSEHASALEEILMRINPKKNPNNNQNNEGLRLAGNPPPTIQNSGLPDPRATMPRRNTGPPPMAGFGDSP